VITLTCPAAIEYIAYKLAGILLVSQQIFIDRAANIVEDTLT